MQVPEDHKQCLVCDRIKPLTHFSPDKKKPDGRYTYCKPCQNDKVKAYYAANKERVRELNRRVRSRGNRTEERKKAKLYPSSPSNIRQRFLDSYGAFCSCCGETERGFLSLEHLQGNGAGLQHKKARGQTGVYRDALNKLRPNNLYTVLCYNCNLGKARNGGICPHEQQRMRAAA